LIDDPFEGRAIAEAVFVSVGRDAREREELVVDERGFVLAQAHFGDAVVEFFSGLFGFGQRVFGLLLVMYMDFGEALTKAWKTSRSDGTGAKARESSCSDAALKGRSSTLAPTLTPSLDDVTVEERDDVTVEERDDVTVEERRFSAASASSLIWALAPEALTNGMRGNSRRKLAA